MKMTSNTEVKKIFQTIEKLSDVKNIGYGDKPELWRVIREEDYQHIKGAAL
jgi:hypothetical protein